MKEIFLHSSAERILSSDATTLLDYMLNRFTNVVKNLTVFTDNMIKKHLCNKWSYLCSKNNE